jgi:heat shock protein HslJ
MDREGPAGQPGDEGSIEDRPWRLTGVLGPAGEIADVAPGIAATATFADGHIQGSTGCNRYVGTAVIDASTVLVTQVASTRRACPPPLDGIEQAFLAALGEVGAYRLSLDALELLGADGAVLLRFEPLPVTPLIGTEWRATAINDGRAAVVSVLEGTTVSMLLAPEGDASGSGGCNRWGGRFERDGDRLRFGAIATTLMACPEPVMSQEDAFHAALGRVASWSIDGDRLQLRSQDGALQVDLVAEAAAGA